MDKIESPDCMDISETATIDNISQESSSPTISNQVNPESDLEVDDKNNKLEEIINTVTMNMNTIKTSTTTTTTTTNDKFQDNLDNQNPDFLSLEQQQQQQQQRLTPVNQHPLMMNNESDSEDSYNNGRVNFPDVVPYIEQQPVLRLANPIPNTTNNTKTTSTSTDLVNSVNNNVGKTRKPMYREPSPDLHDFQSDSEPDLSQYQAEVCPSFQTVSLVSNNQPITRSLQQSSSSPKFLNIDQQRRKIPLTDVLKADDDELSSPEEVSARDFPDDDDDYLDEPLQIPAIPSTSTADNKNSNGNFNKFTASGKLPLNLSTNERIPEYSAADEARNVRNFQLITLPDGKTREIDMKVIEPYKRILSHGGYLKAGGHNAIIVFSACHLPDRSRTDYNYVMNNLFYYVIKTLEQLVTEDYVLVYLHGASNRKNSPPFPWLKKCYQLLDRRLRKSLKSCYIVHPTFWLKSLIWMTRPFISSKFWRKMVYVPSLEELYTLVPVEKNSIPDKVMNYNSRHS